MHLAYLKERAAEKKKKKESYLWEQRGGMSNKELEEREINNTAWMEQLK